jgi:hypothetical protein
MIQILGVVLDRIDVSMADDGGWVLGCEARRRSGSSVAVGQSLGSAVPIGGGSATGCKHIGEVLECPCWGGGCSINAEQVVSLPCSI